MEETTLIDGTPVRRWLRERGHVGVDVEVDITRLSGGVSGVVSAVRAGQASWVIKQALAQLGVPGRWTADPARILVEARALQWCWALTPDHVPRLIDVDPGTLAVMLELIDVRESWRDRLLAEEVGAQDASVACQLGQVLQRWHYATGDVAGLDLGDELLRQLRVDPFYRTTARALPEVADRLESLGGDLLAAARGEGTSVRTFVHGDFTPKNVLVTAAGRPYVIDFEVAHVGAPVLDVGLMLCHLVLKMLHRPPQQPGLERCAADFLLGYASIDRLGGWSLLAEHLGALLLARVHGMSQATYLDRTAQSAVNRLGLLLLTRAPEMDSQDRLLQTCRKVMT